MGIFKSKNYVYPITNDIESSVENYVGNTCFICLETCNVKMKCKCVSYCHKECFVLYLKTRRRNECPFCRRPLKNIKISSPNLNNVVENDIEDTGNYLKRMFTNSAILLLIATLPQFFTGFLTLTILYFSTGQTKPYEVYISEGGILFLWTNRVVYKFLYINTSKNV